MPYGRLANSLVSLKPSWLCAAGVGLWFIVDLEAGKPTLRFEHVLRVIDALGGELTLGGFPSSQWPPDHQSPALDADKALDTKKEARLQALDELVAQAQELKMGYD